MSRRISILAVIKGAEQVGQLDGFLASDAASFINRQDLAVDGGLVPFGKFGWQDSIEFRAEITRRVRKSE